MIFMSFESTTVPLLTLLHSDGWMFELFIDAQPQ